MFNLLGKITISFFKKIGNLSIFFFYILKAFFTPPFRKKIIISQMIYLGIKSLSIAFTVAGFAGMVLAIQAVTQMSKLGGLSRVGHIVTISLLREIGPTLISIVVAGRVSSAIAAELGIMRATEQIDALESMAINPFEYLIVPKLWACMIMFPILVILSNVIGIIGGYCTAVYQLDVDSSTYMSSIFSLITLKDIFVGIFKSFIFGIIIATIGCYCGFNAKGGAEGVGRATTLAVVNSGILIVITNYLISYIFFYL
ncbi:MAG: ABC transporter permease [bacterium]